MKVALYTGKNPVGYSIVCMAEQLASRMEGAAIATSPGGKQIQHADLVVNFVPEDTEVIRGQQRYTHYVRMIVFLTPNWEEYTEITRMTIIGGALVDPFVVHSKYSYDLVARFIREYLSPGKARKALGNLHCIDWGIEPEFSASNLADPIKWIVPYNRINQQQKRVREHHDLSTTFTVAMAQRGKVVDTLFIVHHGLFDTSAMPQYDTYRWVDQPGNRDDYRSLLWDRGAFLCTSKYESFGIYYLELLCSGIVGVFQDEPWVRKLLPSYPLIHSRNNLVPSMLDVVDNYAAYRTLLTTEIVPYIRARYDLGKFATDLLKCNQLQNTQGGEA